MATTQESQHRELQSKNVPGKVDPDVNIPPAVRAASERADAIHKAAYPDPADGAPAQPADDPAALTPLGDGNGEPPAGAPDNLAPGAPVPPLEHPGELGEPLDWEHRYRSLQGRYDKQQEHVRGMADQITNLQSVLATVSSMQPAPQAAHELRAESFLSPEEITDYGPEFLDVVGKKAREIAAPLMNTLQTRINELEQKLGYVGGSIAQTGRDRMFGELDQNLPAWRDINRDPKFFEWLRLPDQYSGAIRHNLLKAAWDRNDTARSLAFFKGFLAEEAVVDPAYVRASQPSDVPPNGSQAPQPIPPGQQNGRVPLEHFAAPGRAKSAAEPPAEKPLIKRSDITKFYADGAAGRYRGNEAEQKRLENMIFAAQRDGRIINA